MGAVLRLCCDRVVRGKGTKRGGALYAYYFGLDPVRGKRRGGSGVWGEKGAAAGGVADRATGNPPPLFFVGGQTRDDKGCQAVDLAGAVTARARAGAVSEGLENNKKQVGGAGNGRERHGRERGGGRPAGGREKKKRGGGGGGGGGGAGGGGGGGGRRAAATRARARRHWVRKSNTQKQLGGTRPSAALASVTNVQWEGGGAKGLAGAGGDAEL